MGFRQSGLHLKLPHCGRQVRDCQSRRIYLDDMDLAGRIE